MELLVLGGTRFVGRTLAVDAVARGWAVTVLNRGRGEQPDGVRHLVADRTDPEGIAAALAGRRWDAVVDTWSGAPAVATRTAALLQGRAERFGYVSSGSVYVWGEHVDESSPVVEGDPWAAEDDYATDKRGAELGVLAAFPDALLARAGLILGPHEDIGRLPWWLDRVAAGGRVVAPGRPERPLQYVDVRDLAAFVLDALTEGVSGPVDLVGPSGHATTRSLLEACVEATGGRAELVWVDEQRLAEAGVEPWTHLPCWVPEEDEHAGFLEVDTSRAAGLGLTCRPVQETVADTWAWMQGSPRPDQRPDRPVHGIPEGLERDVLARV